MSERFVRMAFFASVLFLVSFGWFAFGVAVGRYHIWPYFLVQRLHSTLTAFVHHGSNVPKNLIVEPARDAPRRDFVTYLPDRLSDGYYVFWGWNDREQTYAAWLYSSGRELLHEWVLDYEALDPDGPHNGSEAPHAAVVLEDGTMIVGFDGGDIMARLDSCGDPVWIKSGIHHHSLTRADDGSFWTWRASGTPYGHHNTLENFDASGTTIRQLELVDDLIRKSTESATLFTVRPDYEFREFEKSPTNDEDIFHPNDVDVLHSDLADKFPDFEAGDLLLSFRSIDLVAVIDDDSADIKWAAYGPWRFQHDPDFTADGKISVYNNNKFRGRSEITKIDPATREVSNELFDGNFAFYSAQMGTHQYLPNGNLLIAVPGEGRVVEVTSAGDKVVEFNNLSPRSDAHNMHVQNAAWYPSDYFDRTPECRKN